MDRDQMRDRQYQGDRVEDESSSRQGGERTMTYPSQDRQREGGQSGMERPGSTSSGMTTTGEAGGDWQGFVVPYRYYGPGYAGVGYYAVYYQGGAGQRDEGDTSEESDQRTVRYGQGQGAGAAWQSGRSGGGRGQRYGGQWGSQRGQWQNESGQGGQGGQWQNQGGQWGSESGGGYAGRGPKGYRRSDERIREEISDQFMENDQLDASEIEVQVSDGVVTLTGTVEGRQAKRLAEDMAKRASGVRDVMNHLKVDNESSMRGGGGAQSGTTATGSRGSRTTSGSRSSGSSTGSRARSGTSSGTGSRSSSRTTGGSQGRSRTGQPVGAGTGGATDGATANGSNRDQSNRESEGR